MREVIAELLRQGGSIVSMLIRTREVRRQQPREEATPDWMGGVHEDFQRIESPEMQQWRPKALPLPSKPTKVKTTTMTPKTAKSFEGQSEAGYRAECLSKHFSTGRGILKEAIDRAIDTKMDDPGVTQKIRGAMEVINSAEDDVKAMIPLKEVSGYTDFFNSGMRNLRKAVFEARLETGGGTIDDLKAMHTWAGILLDKAYDMAKEHPGTECQEAI